jgi:hypothetical protein
MKLITAAVAVSISLMLTASPAAAASGDDARTVVIDQTVNPGQMAIASVPCDFNERAVGGGAGFIASNLTWLVSNGPTNQGGHRDVGDGDIPRGWYSAVYNGNATAASFHHYAICSASSDATIQSAAIALPAAQPGPVAAFAENFAGCPAGQVATGGGTSAIEEPTSLDRIEQSGPLDDTGLTTNTETGDTAHYWYAGVRNFDTASARSYTVSAICSATSTAELQVASVPLAAETAPPLVCPTGSRALSGGAVSPDTNQTFMAASGPGTELGAGGLSIGDTATAWYSRTYSFAGAGTNTIKFSAICEAPTPPAPPTPAGATGPTGQRAAALKRCKKKRSKKARRKCRRKAARLPL